MTPRVSGGAAGERLMSELPFDRVPAPVDLPAESVRADRFRQALTALGQEIDRGEKLVRRALSPGAGRLGAGDLIALQAGIYRYSEAVDLAAKLVDRAGSALRTTLQSGGQ
jgi:hypothetical protein